MGLASALSTALTGLNAAETTIDVVGNNVANANTVGFKASHATFATQFLQTKGLGSGPTETRGGTNPRQTGLGTKVAEITPDFTQGTIQISSNPSDLAIQLDGFFIVEGSQGEQLYTRNGQFKTNAQNELVTTTGQRLLGYVSDDDFQIQTTSLEPLTIPLGQAAVAQSTGNVVLAGTLSPTGDVATLPEIIRSAVLSDGTKDVPANLDNINDVGVVSPTATGTTTAANTGAGNIAAGTYTYRIAFVDANGQETAPSAATTAITTTGTAGVDQAIDVSGFPATPAGFTRINIYRSDATQTQDSSGNVIYKLVGNIAAATPTFTDTFADAARTTQVDGPLAQGNYSYYITYRSSVTGLESRPTALIGPESVNDDGRRIQLSNLVDPSTFGNQDFDQIRVYRNTLSNDTEFYAVGTIGPSLTSPITFIDGKSDAQISGNDKINLDGPQISSALKLIDLVTRNGSVYSNPFALGSATSGVLEFTGSKGSRSLATKEFTVTPTSTVGDLITFMSQALGIQEPNADPMSNIPGNPGGGVTFDNRLQFTGNNGVGNAIGVALSAMKFTPAGGTTSTVNLGFGQTQAAVGESAVTNFVVYDALGIPLNVRMTAVLESRTDTSTTYRWFADSSDNDPAGVNNATIAVGTGQIIFDGEGNVTTVTNSTVSVLRDNVSSASPLEFELDFSGISGLAAENSSVAATRQDGSGPGVLSSFIIGEDGLIRGVFSNGVTRDLGQVVLARFSNNAGLEQRGENLFAVGVNSGLPVLGAPGTQGVGTIISGATELSNTDIGQNLIELITASTQYRGGTRVITAIQQLLDELMNLRR